MISEVLDQLVYLKLKSAHSYLKELHINDSISQSELKELNKVIPFNDHYSHLEGNAAAHIKASIIGSSVNIPVSNNNLLLGTWQGICFCEFDGPRTRKFYVKVI